MLSVGNHWRRGKVFGSLLSVCLVAAAVLSAQAADKYWVGGASGNWSDASWADTAGGEGGAWVDGSTAIFSSGSVTIGGSTTQNVARIENTGTGTVTLNCPVKFSGTYYVVQNGPVYFLGGATATYPDDTLRSTTATANTLALRGDFTFTADWTVPSIGNTDAYPWVVTSGSTVRGKNLVGANSDTALILRIDEGGSAYFDSMALGAAKGEVSVDGYLEVAGDMTFASGCSMGRSGNIGTVKANCIKKISGSSTVSCYIPNLIVGAGGIGATYKDYYFVFAQDTTITATADFNFLGMYRSGNTYDWGIRIANRRTLTVNVPENLTVTCGIGINGEGEGCIRKKGAGTLVMTDTYDGQSGYVKNFGTGVALIGSMLVDEGTLKVAASGQLGGGVVRLAEGARMEVSPNVTLSNRIDGKGVLQLANGVTIENAGNPWRVGSVTFATAGDAVTVTAPSGAAAPLVFLTGVASADLSRFTCAAGTLAVKGGALMLADAAAATDYVWNGMSGDDWATPGSWLVNGAAATVAPTSSDTIRFENDAPVTVGGSTALQVTKIVTTSGADVTFACPVQFASTYNVQNAAVAPVFAGGATATIPDASLSSANIPSHEFRGSVTFTDDWTVPDVPSGNPFVVAEYASITGQTVTASAYSAGNYHLRIDKGATATFNTVDVKDKFVFKLNGGRLVATGNVNMWKNDVGQYLDNNVGTVEANAIIRSATSAEGANSSINFYITDMLVGSGGFGMYRRDYNLLFQRNSRLTAKDNLTIHQPMTAEGAADGKNGDWGLKLNGYTFTIDTAGHTVTFDSWVSTDAGKIVKEGEGELVMQTWLKQYPGGTILNGGLTTVRLPGALGTGTVTVNSGATLRFTDEVGSFPGPIVVKSGATLIHGASIADSSTLTLEAGATIKPAQNAFLSVSTGDLYLYLPGSGTVTVDMSDFSFVNGVATPVLGGVDAGDAASFTALVPAGITGGFSVANGILYYTATAGGSAAADLFWHPQGDDTWSTSVAAWTNAAGEQVTFTPYANVTVADAATISLPADVAANDVAITADDDVALNGAGKLGGPGTIVKTGEGTLTFNAQGGLDAQPIIVSNGVFKVGDDLTGHALGASADASPVIIADGATLDVNFDPGESETARNSVTRDKLVRVAGDGYEGQGAVVNNNKEAQRVLSDLILDDDASVGGTARLDVRGGQAGYARNSASIYGPDKTLTVKSTGGFGIVNATVDLDSIVVTNGGVFLMEGATYHLENGVRLVDGGRVSFYGGTFASDVAITAVSGENRIDNRSGTTTYNGPITIAPGATLTHTGGSVIYGGTVNGALDFTGGTIYMAGGIPANGWTINSPKTAGTVRIRQSGTFTGADVTAYAFGVADVANTTVDVTFNDSTLDIANLYMGWGAGNTATPPSGHLSIGPGTTLTAGKICVGDDGTSTSKDIKSVMSVDGGNVHLTGTLFYIAYNGPHSDFIVNSGTTTVDQATIQLRANNEPLGGYNTSRFIQNGGTFNYGGSGFTARFEDNSDEGQIVLKGGTFNASANWSIPHWIPTYFKPGDANGWTLNQAAGTTATWNTALLGDGDVTLNGAATLVGNKEVQGAVGGKWTVGDGFMAGLQGAASLLGGLDIGEGASVTVDIATNRSAVFTARDFGDNPGNSGCITNRFNRAIGGTTRGTITHDMTFFFTKYDPASSRPFGNMNFQSAYAVGDFYVEDGAAGEWSFTAKCDDWAMFWVDGEQIIAGKSGTAAKNLSAGWHSFRHIIIDNSGAYGDAQTIGYKDGSGSMSAYANFSTKNLKMRPAADFGDPNNANTVRWSHYKQPDSADWRSGNYKQDDLPWDFCCITNNLQNLQWYGDTDTTWFNVHTVNRYDGWFYVAAENADKEWTFRAQYDDRCALWIDGVDSGLKGESGNSQTYKVTLSRGWHKFEIRTYDNTGNAGPWSGKGYAVSYQVAGGSETLFSEQTLALSVCPDGYIQGDVKLASGATLSNTATGAALVYGDVIATGTNATISGGFKFEGGKLAFQNVAPNTRDLSTVLAFTNPADDYLADVGAITVDLTDRSKCGKVTVCPAGGLDSAAAAKVTATVNGEPCKHSSGVEDGKVVLRFPVGFMFFVR